MNICTRPHFNLLARCLPSSDIDGSYGKSIFNFFQNHYVISHSGHINLLSHQQCTKFPMLPHPCQNFLFSAFCFCFYNSHPNGCQVISHCGFHVYFPNDQLWWTSFQVFIGHLYFLEKYLFISSVHFWTRLSCCWFFRFLYIFWIWSPYLIYNLQIFPPVP